MDLGIIKQDYAKSGGTDPHVLESMQNLERFYGGARDKGNQGFKPQSAAAASLPPGVFPP
jgi:hypothetical protein